MAVEVSWVSEAVEENVLEVEVVGLFGTAVGIAAAIEILAVEHLAAVGGV